MNCVDPEKQMYEYRRRFRKMTNDDLISTFNSDVGNPGWVGARGRFHIALQDEFIHRGFDISRISKVSRSLSWAKKINLVGQRIIVNHNN